MSFDAAVAYVNSGSGPQVDDEAKLLFYKYYKQATVGDCNVPEPGLLKFTEKAKWKAWRSVIGMSSDEAKQHYVAALSERIPTWNQ